VADIFREGSEEVRAERARARWRRYGAFVVGAVAAVVLAVAGFQLWKHLQAEAAVEAGMRLAEAAELARDEKHADAAAAFAALAGEGGGAGLLAQFGEAAALMRQGDAEGALARYKALSANADAAPVYRDLARLFQGMTELDAGRAEAALATLEGLDGALRHSAAETMAAARAALGDSEAAMVRIDMSEFMEQHSVAKLIGAPPGYVGHEQGGYLTEAVRRRPYSVLLLDEVEKAHAEVFNVLLQVLDDGRLTDSHGRTVDFRNTVIIMTSNLGSEQIQRLMRDASPDRDAHENLRRPVLDAVLRHFPPEFVNRIDELVVFRPLGKQEILRIASLQARLLNQRLASAELQLDISPAALRQLAEAGFDPVFGARPLKRVFRQRIENPLAQHVLAGKFGPGDTIAIEPDGDGELQFRAGAAAAAA